MRWQEIRAILGVLEGIIGSLKGRKARRWARRLERITGGGQKVQAIRLKFALAEREAERTDNRAVDAVVLELTASEVLFLKQIRNI